jgi:hypothetical protein
MLSAWLATTPLSVTLNAYFERLDAVAVNNATGESHPFPSEGQIT